MRKGIVWGMVFLGTFLLVAGGVLGFWGGGALKKTPLGVTSVTHLAGTIQKLNPSTGELEDLDVKVTSVTKTDDNKSDGDVVAFVNTTCVVVDKDNVPDCVDENDPENRLVSATEDVFATDRVTAEAVDEDILYNYVPRTAVPHEGLVNKWPFDAEKKNYTYWDDILKRALPAEYTGTQDIDGTESYTYVVKVENAPAEVVSGIDGLYTAEKIINIDPRTGSVIRQENRDRRTLDNGDVLSDLHVVFTDDQIKDSVKESNDGARQLWLISVLVPIIAGVLGLLLLLGGVILLLRQGRAEGSHAD